MNDIYGPIDCDACNGTGEIRVPDPTWPDDYDLALCSDCGGCGCAERPRPGRAA